MTRSESDRRLARAALVLLSATAMGLVNAAERYSTGRPVLPGQAFGWWEILWPHLLEAWIWASLYPAAAFLCRRVPFARHHRGRAIVIHAAGAVVLVVCALLANFLAVRLLTEGRVEAGDLFGVPFVHTTVYGWRRHLLAYGLALAAAAGVEAGRRARAEALRDAELRTRLAAARLGTLRAQLHPHFLFNTLNGILPLVEDDPRAAARAVGELAALLRESFADGTPFTDLEGERRFLERYLGLLRLRFGERLEYSLRFAPEAIRGVVPRLLLQPLVENAIQHGLARRTEGGRVEVDASRSGDQLVLEVRDDGPGWAAAEPPGSAAPQPPVSAAEPPGLTRPDRAAGLGLANTRARLAALHGDRCSLAVTPRPGGGVVARIVLPFETVA